MNPILFSLACMCVCITLAVLFLMAQGRKVMLRACVALSVPAFLGGIGLYTVAYLPESVTLSDGLTAVLRELFSTGRMFLVNDDYGFVVENAAKEWLVQSNVFRLAFWLCHVLALIVAVSAVVGNIRGAAHQQPAPAPGGLSGARAGRCMWRAKTSWPPG